MRTLFRDDIVSSVFEMEKGFFFTLGQLLTRPGHAVREYVSGKRATYYNFFSLLFLIVAIDILLQTFAKIHLSDLYEDTVKSEPFLNFIDKLNNDYAKPLVLLMIPVYALFAFFLFRRAKQNFAEHFVANAYRAALELFLGLSITVSMIFVTDIDVFRIITQIVAGIALIYSIVFYYQYFKPYGYSPVSLLLRSVGASLASNVLMLVLVMLYGVWIALSGQTPDTSKPF
jgi:hypothetical protein